MTDRSAGLDDAERALVVLAGLTTLGDREAGLRDAVPAALGTGLRPDQLVEAYMHMVPFVGFARVLRAVLLTRDVLRAAGITVDTVHVDPPADRFGRGLELMHEIAGEGSLNVLRTLADIAPGLGRQIVEFTYADNYARPGLDVRRRLLVTVSALIALGDTELPLGVQMTAAVANGVNRAQVRDAIDVLAPLIGPARSKAAAAVAERALGGG